MANTDAANGFEPVTHNGSPKQNKYGSYSISTDNDTAIFPGDPVVLQADGDIALAGTGSRIVGVFNGCSYKDANGVPQFGRWPGTTTNTDIEAFVYDDPDTVFKVQADTSLAATDVGLMVPGEAGSGSTVFDRSRWEVDASEAVATEAQWRVLDKVNEPENAWGTNVKILVKPYYHEYNTGYTDTPGV